MEDEPLVYLHNDFHPQRKADLALNDAGFVMGVTVTDLCRTFRHRLFRLDEHLHRFRQSCALARVPQSRPDAELVAIAERLVAHNTKLVSATDDLALVMFATPGPIGYYLGDDGGAGDAPPTLGMHTFPLPLKHATFALSARGAPRHPECPSHPSTLHRSALHQAAAASAALVARGSKSGPSASGNQPPCCSTNRVVSPKQRPQTSWSSVKEPS